MNNKDNFVISTQGLTKAYNGTQVLKSLDLKVPRNSIFGFLGPNGAGKSTAIKLLLGLIKPTSGTGSIFGMNIEKNSAGIRKRIGYLPQNPKYYDYMTAREIMRFTAGFFYSTKSNIIEEKINEALMMTGLQDKADRSVKGFSAGELQRLGIAQAQVNSPDLLILDEPAASLDPMGRRDVLDVMRSLKGKTTIFYSTHIINDVERVSDTVGILNHGKLVALAPIEELLCAKENIVYNLIIHGNEEEMRSRILAEPWVSSVTAISLKTGTKWLLTAKDETSAEKLLLRTLLQDERIMVKEFSRSKFDLEDVFMMLCEGERNE